MTQEQAAQEQHRVQLTANNLVTDYCNRTKKKVKNLKHDDYLQIIGHAAAVGIYTGLKMAKETMSKYTNESIHITPEAVEGTPVEQGAAD